MCYRQADPLIITLADRNLADEEEGWSCQTLESVVGIGRLAYYAARIYRFFVPL